MANKQTARAGTILVVENEPSLSDVLQTILRTAGYRVAAAYTGAEALEMAAKISPALIVLDLRLPERDGLEFLRQYKESAGAEAKVIVLSSYDTPEIIDKVYLLG